MSNLGSISAVLFFVLAVNVSIAQQEKSTLIRYATVHVGNGEVIDNAYVVFHGSEISRVSDANKSRINPSDYDTIIDADGKHLYPGFILMDSRIGLIEIDQVKATHDFRETGKFLPNVRALPAFNAESKILRTIRSNGVLMAQIAPNGAVISGTSSLMKLDGDNWQESVFQGDEGIFLEWPSRARMTGWWAELGKSKENKKYEDQVSEIIQFFAEAKADQALDGHVHANLRFESMADLFNGDQRLYVRVDHAKDILDAVQFFRESGVQNMVIVGGAEADLVINELKENDIPVIIDRVHKLPIHTDDPIEKPYRIAGVLQKAGIKIAFATSGSMETMIGRNLPFQVGTAIYHGLPYEQAIRALSLSPAEIMGVSETIGSIEPGKVATFFLCEGDPLDIRTNQIEAAYIMGKPIDLSNHQSRLAEKFMKKHGVD